MDTISNGESYQTEATELADAAGFISSRLQADTPGTPASPHTERAEDEIWQVWQTHQNHIMRVLRTLGNIPESEREEILSLVLMHFHTQYPKHAKHIQRLQAWLSTLARNVAFDYLRGKQRDCQRHVSLDEQSPFDTIAADNAHETLAALENRELGQMIQSSFEGLSPVLRDTATAHFLHGKTYPEIAQLEDIQEATVRKRIQSVRNQLRTQLSGYLEGGEPILESTRSALPGLKALAPKPPSSSLERPFEIPSTPRASKLIPVPGQEATGRFSHLFLMHQPVREAQKIDGLQAYMKRHTCGYRKQLELAELYCSTGRWAEALAHYERLAPSTQKDLLPLLRMGSIHRQQGRISSATSAYRHAHAICHEPATRQHLTGLIAYTEKRPHEALQAFQKASVAEQKNPAHNLVQAEILLAQGYDGQAFTLLNTCQGQAPDHLPSLLLLLDLLAQNGAYGRLEKIIHILQARGETNAVLIKHVVDAQLRSGPQTALECDRLRRTVIAALERVPGFPGLLDTKATLFALQGQRQRLIRLLDQMVEEFPLSAPIWQLQASWLSRLGRHREALRASQYARTLDPHSPAVLEAAALIAISQNAPQYMEAVCGAIVACSSPPPRLLLTAAVGQALILRQPDTALQLSARAVQCAPTLPVIVFGHARLLRLAKRIREAHECFQHAWDLLPAGEEHVLAPAVATYMADCCHALGWSSEARSWSQQASAQADQLTPLDPRLARYWNKRSLALQSGTASAIPQELSVWNALELTGLCIAPQTKLK